ncbi:hypothetical protein O7627_06155 [Solwaraspora sp. WMMD1047]|uniref:hypothetical protein n=1 Tax=Solwaraspora sp. WMMD1047 TaxID=3016102 RepID=UPI0024166922|nr:hypothetical protein [Solwaraspora sp. WMMD1047]MDG4828888.1 hypothetical protein [Solwaraspora sp. WMMD1047]
MIPPTSVEESVEEGAEATRGPRNPWLELGLGSLSRAAALTVQDQAVLKQLDAEGFSENVIITRDDQQPIMTIEVIADSKEQATETSEEIIRRLSASMDALQADYGANEESFITARRLDRGDNIEVANSKVKRAMVAVGGVGVLLSAALTIGIDGLLRRRRVKPAADPAGPTGTPRESEGVSLLDQRRARPQPSGAAQVQPLNSGHVNSGYLSPGPAQSGSSGSAQPVNGGRAQSGNGGRAQPVNGGSPAPSAGTAAGAAGQSAGTAGQPAGQSESGARWSGMPAPGAWPPPPSGSGVPVTPGPGRGEPDSDIEKTAVIGVVPPDDATIILPTPRGNADPRASAPEQPENGSRIR